MGFRAENEASIVTRVFEDLSDYAELTKYKVLKRPKLTFRREFTLQNGKRIDIFAATKNERYAWIIEFKLHSDIDSIIQVLNYERTVDARHGMSRKRLRFIQKTIIAETFCERAVFFAERHKIQLLQFNHVTKNHYSLSPVVDLLRNRGHGYWAESLVYTDI